jgi:predicted Zn-dependent peptidase
MRRTFLAAMLLACGCAPAATATAPSGPAAARRPDVPRTSAAPVRESPPPSGAAREWNFPPVKRTKLASGAALLVVASKSLPMVELRAVVHAGLGYGAPGLAQLTAELLRDGGAANQTRAQVADRLESLGASLAVAVDFDATTLAVTVPTERAEAAALVLADIVERPKFDDTEFRRARDRAVARADEGVQGDAEYVASRIATRELVSAPYANAIATPGEIAKITPASVRAFYKTYYGASNVTLVVVGDVADGLLKTLEGRFGKPRGDAAPKPPEAAAPKPVDRLRVVLCDRPKSAQSDIFLVGLAPERRSNTWPELRVANQILGGGVASRLFATIRERDGLAYDAGSQILTVAQGPQLFVVHAGTDTAKTADTTAALLSEVAKLRQGPPPGGSGPERPEVESAVRYLRDAFAVQVDGISAIAELATKSDVLRLGDDYWDKYRAALARVDATGANAAAGVLARGPALAIVVADAATVERSLARFGPITVVNPTDDFKVVRTSQP